MIDVACQRIKVLTAWKSSLGCIKRFYI